MKALLISLFPLTEKYIVKGIEAHPFFKWTKKELGSVSGVPRWNFHKIIIDKNGNAVAGYTALTKPRLKEIHEKNRRYTVPLNIFFKNIMHKSNLPSKICSVCGRPFNWRKNGNAIGKM